MHIPTRSTRPWIGAAAIVAVAVVLISIAYVGNATAVTRPPEAPANPLAHLIVTDNANPRIRVSWDAPDTSASSYTITRADGTTFQAAGRATTYSDHTVEPGTDYQYSVAAHSDQGSSQSSASASASVPDAPSQPGDLAAEVADIAAADENTTVTLTWLASTVAPAAQCETHYPLDGYTVVRSDGDQETEIATPSRDDPSFTDDSAAFGTTYTYRVMARSAIGSSPAAAVTVVTPFRPVPPPTGLSASVTDPFDGTATVSWEAPSEGPDVAGYQVLRSDRGATATVLVDNVNGNVNTDGTAEAGVPYSYTIRARSTDNISAASEAASIEAPAPASSLTATAGDGTINLGWSVPKAGAVVGYRIARQQQDGEWATLTETTETAHSDETARPNIHYRYRVQHRNQHGGSVWAESNQVTLIAVPGKPTNLATTVEGIDNVLTWTAPDNPVIDGYRLQHRIGEAEWDILAEGIVGTNYRHASTQADLTHHYAVQAYNSAGNSPWSDTASATRITPPAVPQNVSAQLDGDDIVVNWTKPNSVHVSGYTVRRQAGDTDYVESERLAEGQTNFRLLDVKGDIMYRIAVQAHNNAGDSPWSDDVRILRRLAPSVPTNVAVSVGEVDIILSWEVPETGTPDGYHVQNGEQDSNQLQTANLPADQTSYIHSDNVEGVTYQYRVRAHNTAGESAWSENLTATRTLAPPAPTNLTGEVSGSVITVSWTASATGIINTYEVQYGTAGSDENTTASVDGSKTSFLHLGADGDTRHSYRVRSVNSAGNSAWAGPVEAMWVIPPTPPTGVTAEIDGNDILVSWTKPDSNFIDEYQVQFREQNNQEWTRTTVNADQTGYHHVGPTPGITHEYRIRAVNTGGVSQWSEVANAVWYRTTAPPRAIIFTPLGTRMLVQWVSSETPGVTNYQLRYRIDGGEWNREDLTAAIYLADWSSDQTFHEYQIRALKGDDAGDWSAIHRATVATPEAVTSLTLNREGASSVRLHWQEPASGPPARYLIQGRWRGKSEYRTVAATAGHITTTRNDIGYDSEYTYRVLAQNHVGINGPHQEGVTAHIAMPTAERQWPEVPFNINTRMLDPTTVKLTWNPPQQRGAQVTNYRIYRKLAADNRRIGDSYRDHVLVAYTRGTSTSYIDHTAQAGVAYEYGVAAYRDGYTNPWSSISHRTYAKPWD